MGKGGKKQEDCIKEEYLGERCNAGGTRKGQEVAGAKKSLNQVA